ncbi:MAG: SusD/RagB family nutrient-binding outer membrane lipoprotein [Paludibacter sp.]|nr:SusD/RagB family nutrient-binding outer membrane lipoprotein [Bacteroidales bacterium]MCM1069717.1 SusD/RagB family nutrient-binding outer membrane lipoprotein [Prevotella sp.]MCM1354375.1 SusD/RagB family nutrient-binding outer membrane lipoprotein [Bacteroides sp.]MCM1441922.1 SusD/RagB family nutrient-binding outer membrane lipoprotein [Muribaculum sp.]MCM1482573.1 SusD/RagB family nutrient-binding outer membrane lipoprotein [Paludibacter sp.]
MKKINYIVALLCCVLLSGCEDFLDVNHTKDSPTTVSVDQALPVACFYASQLCYDHAEYGVYMSQALTTASKNQTGSYPYSEGWEFLSINRHPMWRRHFYDLGANIEKLKEAAQETGALNYVLIARTIMLQSTMLTTDLFGEMPCTEAYKATSPKYDSQQEIYDWMFKEADELVALYDDPEWTDGASALPISEKADRIYKGDMQKWAAYTKALRCRLWLRKLPNWDNTPATCQKIVAMVDEVLNDPAWEEPLYVYTGGKSEQNCPWGPAAPVINAWESRANRLATSIPTTFFASAILGTYKNYTTDNRYALDPRAEMIMTPRELGTTAGTQCMRWLESNIGMDVSMKVTYYPDLFASEGHNPYTSNDGYVALFTDEELLFIKAEALYWANQKAESYAVTKQAVERSMMRYGVDVTAMTSKAKKRYELFFDVRLPGATEFNIATLMQQKYVAMYLQPEQWTDMRRYNYSSKTNGIFYDGVPVYTVTTCHDGSFWGYEKENFSVEYSLRRPFNLYVPYWDQPDCYEDPSTKAVYSPNAWVNRLNPDTETEMKYNLQELIRIGACDAGGQADYRWMKKRMIWGYMNPTVCTCSNSIEWK